MYKDTKIYQVLFSILGSETVTTWGCVRYCGACCHLDPIQRPELADYLSEPELELYLTMVGEGGWCVNFHHSTRECGIYEERPDFCRVKPDSFQRMYEVDPSDFDEFAIDCCHQQIEAVYGVDSREIRRYHQEVENSPLKLDN